VRVCVNTSITQDNFSKYDNVKDMAKGLGCANMRRCLNHANIRFGGIADIDPVPGENHGWCQQGTFACQ
jgi:hypothetical protein